MMRGTRSKGKNALRAARIAVNIERDALAQESEVHGVAFGVQSHSAAEAREGGLEFLVVAEARRHRVPNISSKKPFTR